jgi:hypothetical protein
MLLLLADGAAYQQLLQLKQLQPLIMRSPVLL